MTDSDRMAGVKDQAIPADALAALKEMRNILATLIDPNSQHVSSQTIFAQATEAESKARRILTERGIAL